MFWAENMDFCNTNSRGVLEPYICTRIRQVADITRGNEITTTSEVTFHNHVLSCSHNDVLNYIKLITRYNLLSL